MTLGDVTLPMDLLDYSIEDEPLLLRLFGR